MPISAYRDMRLARAALRAWLAERLGAPDVEVSVPVPPVGNGFSSETMLLEATWSGGERGFVVHVQPTTHRLFLDHDIRPQYEVMRTLAERTDVPMPPMLWHEPDDEVLGAPFFVMGRVRGRVPPDSPPYQYGSWVSQLSESEREVLWWNALEAMSKVHTADCRALGLGRWLDRPERGRTGLEQQIAYWRESLEWATGGNDSYMSGSLDRLADTRPDDAGVGIVWGDARLGNMMFDGTRCVAVLDWEMVGLGPPEVDLGWFLVLDRWFGGGYLRGIPSPERTIEMYGELIGRPMRHMDWYHEFASMRISIITRRFGWGGFSRF